MVMKWLISAAPVALACGCGAQAQTAPIDPATATTSPMPGQTKAASDGQGSTIQEIVVTAQKRSENLQAVPQAITVINGAAAELRGQTGLGDLQASVPNLTFASTQNMSQFFIRGVGTTFINGGGDPGVAFYQDNAYVSDQTTTNTAMFDVDHTEVLRGAQGALFGRNAVGGAINVISAKPTSNLTASVMGELGDYGRHDSEGAVSGPLGIANTDVRIAYQIQNRDGYTKNLLAGQPGAPDNLDDLHSQAFRIYTLTHLPGSGTFAVIYNHYNENDNGPALGIKPMPGVLTAYEYVFGNAAIPSSDPRAVYAKFGKYSSRVDTLNAQYVQPLGSNTLTVLGNYRSSDQSMYNDCSGSSAPACLYNRPTSSKDLYGDIHLASPSSSRFNWLIGGSYLRFILHQINDVDVYGYGYIVDLINGGTIYTNSWAAYADLKYHITDTLTLNAQARYNVTTKSASQISNIAIPAFGYYSDVENYTGPGSYLRNSSTPVKAGIEWRTNRDVMFYASFATAEKDGAINLGALQPQPISPEKVTSFEVGEKATLFNRRLMIDSALFYSKYRGLQISQILGEQTVLVNVPRSSIKGAELELTAIPVSGVKLNVNAGYLDAKILDFVSTPDEPSGGPYLTPATPQQLHGNQLPYDAKYNVNLDAAYEFNISKRLRGSLDAQYAWRSRVYFTEFNQLFDSQRAIGVVNLFASITPNDGPWKIFAFVHNLTNRTVETGETLYSNSSGAERAVSYAAPRQFAVGVALKF